MNDNYNIFIDILKKEKKEYKCNMCGYSQGHQIIYCPKCPGKMKQTITAELENFKKNPIEYKYKYTSLFSVTLTNDKWLKIAKEIISLI